MRQIGDPVVDHAPGSESLGEITRGSVLFEGRDLRKISEAQLRGVRGGSIGRIFLAPKPSPTQVLTSGR